MIAVLLPRPHRTLAVVSLVFIVSVGWPAVALRKDWLGWFPATMSSFLVGAVWGSVAICTASAWISGGVRRSGLTDWAAASARGVRGVYGRPVIICSTVAGAAYLVSFLAMTVSSRVAGTEQSSAQSTPLAVVLLLAWASAGAWAAIGTVLGRYARAEVAIPLALIVAYSAYVVPVIQLVDTPLLGAVVVDGRQWLTLQPTIWQLAMKIFLWCGLAVFFSAVATSARKLLLVGTWMCISGLTGVLFLGSTLSSIPGAADRVCRGSDPRVCTDRAHATVLPQFQAVASSAIDVLPLALRPRVLDDAVQPAPGVLPVAPVDGFTAPALTIDRDATVVSIGEALFYRCPSDGGKRDVAEASLDVWWRLSLGVSIAEKVTPSGAPWLAVPELVDAPRQGRALAALAASARRAWFERNTPAITQCTLEDIVWP